MKTDSSEESEILRLKAEEVLKNEAAVEGIKTEQPIKFSAIEMQRIIHDLEVHQIELKLQNEELQLSKGKVEDAAQQYTELYDFAPSAYFTLSKDGRILKLNLRGAQMLDKERIYLQNQIFSTFVTVASRPVLSFFLKLVFESKKKETCELNLQSDNDLPLHVHISGIAAENGVECYLTIVDISEQKHAANLVKQTHVNYETFFNSIDEFLFVLDMKANIIHVNATVTHRLGYTTDELIGKSIITVHPTYLQIQAKKIVDDILFSTTSDYQIPLSTKSGFEILVETRILYSLWNGKPAIFGISKDISQIEFSEEKVSKVFFLNPSACSLSDLETGKHVEVNDAFYSLFGFDKTEVIGNTFESLDIITRNSINARFLKLGRGSKIANFELNLKAKNGDIKHVLLSAETISIYDKKYRFTVLHDFTERKQAEILLEQTRQNHETFFNSIEELLFVLDNDAKIQHVNKTVCDRLGYKTVELIGNPILMLHPPELWDETSRIVAEILLGKTKKCQIPVITKSGIKIPVETKVTHGLWNGKPAIFAVTKDISSIQLSEEKFSKVFYLNPSACGLDDLETGKYVEVNDAFCTLFGFDKNEVVGKTPLELGILSPEGLNDLKQKIDDGKSMINVEADLKTKTGEIKHVLLSSENISFQNSKYRYTVVYDHTQRKKAEDVLKESESNLAEAQRIAHIGSWEWNTVTNTVKWSKEMFNIFDVDPENFDEKPESLIKVVHPDDVEAFFDSMLNYISGQGSSSLEYRIFRKDATIRTIFSEAKMLSDTKGNSRKIIGTVQDITERKKAEEDIRKANSFLDSIVEHIPNMVFIKDAKTLQFVRFNRAGEELLGISKEEMIGKSDFDFFSKKQATGFRENDKSVLNSTNMLDIPEEYFQTRNKGMRILHTKKVPILNAFGKPEYLLGISDDITEIKQAEQALKISEEKYRTMLNASPDGILLTDLKGNITEVSEITLALFGADSVDDLMGKNVFKLVPPYQRNIIREIIDRTMNDGLIQNIELKISKKNETLFDAEMSATLIQGQSGTPLSFMIIIRDISQRKKTETKLLHADRMASLGEMATGIAHEINQPLNIISMVMDKILFESAKTNSISPDFFKIKSDRIFENITRIRNIIDHIRAFSRSHDDFVLTSFDINISIYNAVSMISEQFKQLGITLNLELDDQINQIVGNTFKFEQVIINLLVNAKDAVIDKKSQQTGFDDMQVGIKSYTEGELLFVEISDNGIGIHNDDIINIVLPFYTTKEEGKGTGLGLTICYQIIKEMKGSIEITSDKSFGTNIKITLDYKLTEK